MVNVFMHLLSLRALLCQPRNMSDANNQFEKSYSLWYCNEHIIIPDASTFIHYQVYIHYRYRHGSSASDNHGTSGSGEMSKRGSGNRIQQIDCNDREYHSLSIDTAAHLGAYVSLVSCRPIYLWSCEIVSQTIHVYVLWRSLTAYKRPCIESEPHYLLGERRRNGLTWFGVFLSESAFIQAGLWSASRPIGLHTGPIQL